MENNTLARKNFKLADKELELWIFVDSENNPWFKAKEVASFMGYSRERDAIADNVSHYNKQQWETIKIAAGDRHLETPSNWHPKTIFINEPGLYELMLKSKLPNMERFQRWVTSEVLPSIRKTGAYVAENINQSQLSQLLVLISLKETQLETKNNEFREMQVKKDKMIENLVKSTTDLAAKVLEQKPRLAAMPSVPSKAHVLRIYSNTRDEHHYKFVRPQQRNLPNINKQVWLKIYERTIVPNAMNVLNIYKTHLKENNIKYIVPNPNEIIVELIDVPTLVCFINNLLET